MLPGGDPLRRAHLPGAPSWARRGRPYRAQYVVTATDERAAMAEALLQFHADASFSGVGWVREPRHEAIEVHAQ